tara:strand:+ start:31 stop:258 length:228 start_codon:yes stop_codon:yes gene_type:complete
MRTFKKYKETYYLVEFESSTGGRDNEGVFTEKGWEKYIKGLNEDRVADGCEEDELYEESMEENMEFIFTEIEVYN